MTLGTILDVSLRIIRRHWPSLLGISLLLAGPGALLMAATGVRFRQVAQGVLPPLEGSVLDPQGMLTMAEFERLAEAFASYALATVVAGALASIGALAMSAIVVADYHGRRIELMAALRVALRKVPAALLFILVTSAIVVGVGLAGIAIALALAIVVGGGDPDAGGPATFPILVALVATVLVVVVLTVRWAPAFPAMVAEDLGPTAALRRSWQLSGGNAWRAFFVVAMGTLTATILAAFITQLIALVLVDQASRMTGLDAALAESISVALGAVLMAPLAPVLIAVLYFDLRARRDTSA